MISVQRMLGRPREFFGLLEQSAALGAESVTALRRMTENSGRAPDLTVFHAARRKDKEVVNRLEEMLARIFVTPIDREDLEEAAQNLYRLPKAVEKFAELYSIVWQRVADVDMGIPLHMLESAVKIIVEMVRVLAASGGLSEVKSLDARLSQIELDSSVVICDAVRKIYAPGGDPLKAIATHDLYRALTNCIDVCRSIGRTLALVTLKNS